MKKYFNRHFWYKIQVSVKTSIHSNKMYNFITLFRFFIYDLTCQILRSWFSQTSPNFRWKIKLRNFHSQMHISKFDYRTFMLFRVEILISIFRGWILKTDYQISQIKGEIQGESYCIWPQFQRDCKGFSILPSKVFSRMAAAHVGTFFQKL